MEKCDILNDDFHARNPDGCWTCRLRRKKCDRQGPVCGICSALLITCHYTLEKPDWVDGGERQRKMAEQFKQEVRDKAPYRRSLAYAKAADEPMSDAALLSLPEVDLVVRDTAHRSTDPPRDAKKVFPGPGYESTHASASAFPAASSATPSTSTHALPPQRASDWAGLDRGLVVCYLDFYFPFLFPFYQPSILDRGRAWIIDFMTESQAMEQTTISLSSYFFSLALDTAKESAHEECRKIAWDKLLGQIHGTFSLLQQELQVLAAGTVSECLPRVVHVMGCIMLLQRFETAIWSYENCEAHLSAATELFQQALEGVEAEARGPTGSPSRFAYIMHQLRCHAPPWPKGFSTFQAPSSEQMAFRFFSALLLVDDVIASTALDEEPRLTQYHDDILGNGQWGTEKESQIHLESIMGCQNWAIVVVAQISTLAAWKKRQKAAGDLDVMELALRAAAIKSVLVANLTRIEVSPSAVPADANRAWDIFTPCNGQASTLADQSLLVTRIWAHAAALYLCVVVSGWQPSSTEVRHHVSYIIELLTQRMLSWAVFRTVAWPFCIAGCLAGIAQEPLFRSMAEGLRPPGLLGSVQKALQIMEAVWQIRDSLDSTSWDLAACFKIQGHLVLLL